MRITKQSLDDVVSENIISAQQAARLYDFLANRPGTGPVFNFTNVLCYLGGLIAVGAMTLLMNLGWESFGGWGIFFIALGYVAIGLRLTEIFRGVVAIERNRANRKIPFDVAG